jgi:Tfp pilus assembly protein PilO
MKKLLPITIWLTMCLCALLAVFAVIMQLRSSAALNKELGAKKEELHDAQIASRKMEDLEKRGQELKQKENKMIKRVALNDTQPLYLIKSITGLASKIGLRKISFELKAASAVASNDKKPRLPPSAPVPVYFEMKFDASFAQVLKFLRELNGLERIVAVEKIEINREVNILPYQSVVLDLVTYTFTE